MSELISPACCFPPYVECKRWYSVSSVLAEAGCVQSRLRFVGKPITLFLRLLRPSKMFLTADLLLTAEASLGNACEADCGAAAAFGKEEISIFESFFNFALLLIFFSFASCDVGYFFVAQFHSIDVPRWYGMKISSSRSRTIFTSSF